ncbi:MAG: hypothetical protein AAF696_19600 [Bacteroidota bacterium]
MQSSNHKGIQRGSIPLVKVDEKIKTLVDGLTIHTLHPPTVIQDTLFWEKSAIVGGSNSPSSGHSGKTIL